MYESNNRPFEIERGLAGLTVEQLQAARSDAEKLNIPLYQSIIKLGFVSEIDFLKAVGEKTGLELILLSNSDIIPGAIAAVTANVASYYNIIPVKIIENTLWLATANPQCSTLKQEIELVLDNSFDVKFILAPSDAISKAIRKSYGLGAATVEQMVIGDNIVDKSDDTKDVIDENKAHEASIIKLVNQLLADAINAQATDIHIEPYENALKARYRIDGILHDAGIPNTVKFFREGISSRIKILSGLDIAEKRLPQDGRAQVNLAGRKFDLRISVLPTRYGEAINIRILPQGTHIADLRSLGMPENEVRIIKSLIKKPHGIILVTGPTGSGKTTTLYAFMNLLKDTARKIITIEDPVEYDMPGIIQMQAHPDIGFTFARALRSMLRHDPDIMLVGEIRDFETAETAIRTALTGHLVFSTLHTNDAASALTRLLDMGIEPYLAASSIDAILAQRLVRVICQYCREPSEPTQDIATAIKAMTGLRDLPVVFHGHGCPKCRFSGFHGRTAITELLIMSDNIRQLTIEKRNSNEIDASAQKNGMTSLFQSGLQKVHNGTTTYDEVLRVSKAAVQID